MTRTSGHALSVMANALVTACKATRVTGMTSSLVFPVYRTVPAVDPEKNSRFKARATSKAASGSLLVRQAGQLNRVLDDKFYMVSNLPKDDPWAR